MTPSLSDTGDTGDKVQRLENKLCTRARHTIFLMDKKGGFRQTDGSTDITDASEKIGNSFFQTKATSLFYRSQSFLSLSVFFIALSSCCYEEGVFETCQAELKSGPTDTLLMRQTF